MDCWSGDADLPAGSVQMEIPGLGPRTYRRSLDVGGGRPRGQFKNPQVADLWTTLDLGVGADLQADLCAAPLKTHSFDLVKCTEVFYLVANLADGLSEIARILRPGGVLIATSPLTHPEIEPHDYGRYSQLAWHMMLDRAGFTDVEVRPLGNAWSLLWQWAYLMDTALIPEGKGIAWLIAKTARMGRWLDGKLDRSNMDWPLEYGIVART